MCEQPKAGLERDNSSSVSKADINIMVMLDYIQEKEIPTSAGNLGLQNFFLTLQLLLNKHMIC